MATSHPDVRQKNYSSKSFYLLSQTPGKLFSILSIMPQLLSSRIQIMPARQPAIQLRSNSPVHSSTPHFNCHSTSHASLSYVAPILPMRMHLEESRPHARKTDRPKCKSCSRGIKTGYEERIENRKRRGVHPFDANGSGGMYVL
jgi:hypothetical protein